MPSYKYRALSADGSIVEDVGEFESPLQLYNELQTEGLVLLEYSPKRSFGFSLSIKRIKRREIAEFLHQLSLAVGGGLPLLTALEDLEGEVKNKALSTIIGSIKKSLRSGLAIREAFAKTKAFSPIVISLIQIGEESGTLDRAFEEASQHLYRLDDIISQTKRALIYPTFILIAMTGALSFWIFYVLPQILKVFVEMKIKLPLPTLILMKVLEIFSRVKFFIPLFIVGLIVLFQILRKKPKTEILIEKSLLKVPILGRVKRINFLAFFFEHFSLLLTSGLDLRRILNLLKNSFSSRYYQGIVQTIEETIYSGEDIATAIKRQPIFRPLDARMVAMGEKTGRLDNQMKILAKFYYQEVHNLLDQLTKILEPVIIVVAGLLFFFIVIALIGPLYDLLSQVGKG